MRRVWVLLALILLVLPISAFQIVEFCPDPYLPDDEDEFIVLAGSGAMDRITVSDGEGGFRFPPGSVARGRVVIARSAAAFNRTHGFLPDYEWSGTVREVPDAISGSRLRMANSRDELMLYDGSVLIQTVSWPNEVKSREGQIHYFESGEWDPRPLLIGQTRFEPETFDNVSVTAFVSPDSASGIVGSSIRTARQSVHLNVYEFTSVDLAGDLITAKEHGADVLILLEGGPVGGISPEEKSVIYSMNHSGIPVFLMAAAGDQKPPYRFDHAKYAVIDETAVLLTSENFKGSGIPPEGKKGNRGWGVYLEDPALAAYFEKVFISDLRMKYSIPSAGTAGPDESAYRDPYSAEFVPGHFTGARVTPVISPDTSHLVLDLIESAQESIEIEQAYITNETATSLNPYLSAAIDASRRGVRVRVLLDSYWYNIGDEKDNDEMAALINRIATVERLPLEARCADLGLNNLEKIHNKGVIVDGRTVLVSSINWNSNSPNFNREAGVIIEHEGVAGYFRAVFEDDWSPALRRNEGVSDPLRYIVLAGVVLVLIVLYYRTHTKGR